MCEVTLKLLSLKEICNFPAIHWTNPTWKHITTQTYFVQISVTTAQFQSICTDMQPQLSTNVFSPRIVARIGQSSHTPAVWLAWQITSPWYVYTTLIFSVSAGVTM